MTTEQKTQFIREKCIEANPEIKTRNNHIVDNFLHQLSETPITEDWFNFADENIKSVMTDILYSCLPSTITLEDVLMACINQEELRGVEMSGSFTVSLSILSLWEFGKPLTEQSEELKNFVYEILKDE